MKMKKGLTLALASTIALATTAQTGAKPKPAAKPVAKTLAKSATSAVVAKPVAKVVLKDGLDSMSYAIGILDASFFKQQGIEKLNYDLMMAAVKSVLENQSPLLTPQQADQIMRSEMQKASLKKIEPQIEEGAKFLAANKKRPEVKVTASGLQYEVVKQGTGIMPKDTNTVKVHYVGNLLNGTKFDSSRDRGTPIEFALSGVIPGWTEGLQLMPVGSIYKLYIPYNLAYGVQGSPPTIPGGSTLVFEVELLDVVIAGAKAEKSEHEGHNHH